MGRRRVKQERENLLTDDLVLKALSIYSKPVPVVMVCRQICHIEKRFGSDYRIYTLEVREVLDRLAKAGRVQSKLEEGRHIPDNPGLFSTDVYWLGPLERLALQ